MELLVMTCECNHFILEIDMHGIATYDTALAPSTSHESSV